MDTESHSSARHLHIDSQTGDRLEIVFGVNTGGVDGTVVNKNGEPVPTRQSLLFPTRLTDSAPTFTKARAAMNSAVSGCKELRPAIIRRALLKALAGITNSSHFPLRTDPCYGSRVY
jgi:hypothetical protein